jgi:hypothetical protein
MGLEYIKNINRSIVSMKQRNLAVGILRYAENGEKGDSNAQLHVDMSKNHSYRLVV